MGQKVNAAMELIRCSRRVRREIIAACKEDGSPLRHQALWQWIKQGKIPPVRVPTVARVLGIPPSSIRPDLPQLFPADAA
jgi:hypothetical protein